MWNHPIKDEDEFMDMLMGLPPEEFEERILLIQELIMSEIIDKKVEEGKMVFSEVENGMLN